MPSASASPRTGDSAVAVVRRAVRSALATEDARPGGWTWPDGLPEAPFLDAVARHRVAQVLAPHSAEHRYPDGVAATLEALRNRGRLEAMAGVHAAAKVHEQLAGIDHLFLKGPALAVQTTGDPTSRGSGDIDLLVRPQQLTDAVDALARTGWSVRPGYTVDRSTWAWRHQLHALYELVLDGPLGSIDLHWRLDPTIHGLPSFDEVWSRRADVRVGEADLPTLSPPDALTHSLRHAAKDRWDLLRSLVDVHRLAGDPSTASRATAHDRLSRMTLTITEATIGLPAAAPAFRRTRAGLAQAVRAQEQDDRRAHHVAENSWRHVQYALRSSRHPKDLAVVTSGLVLPPLLTWEVTERRALPAVAAAARIRVSSAIHREHA
ncbi:nucleotidyltransferase family protein [Nocardioides montaniterrae]